MALNNVILRWRRHYVIVTIPLLAEKIAWQCFIASILAPL